ncbi:MAG TPA: protein kinase [Gemmatimonadales bacterium]|nr:protein kinase [Gemmatimonadales bacterium]
MSQTSNNRLAASLAGRYRVEQELGRGGMATVYRAWDLQHDRPVALKVLHEEIAHTIGTERFLREIKVSARLQHPHILTVLDSGETGGQFWFTMPYIDGETLATRLKRERQLPLEDALQITREVADALEYAHGHGILHRDIKPGNILLSGRHALVSDFGIARATQEPDPKGGRLTETGFAIGTPEYMSPEQAAGEREIDARSDLYALACVVYEMLSGEPPYLGNTPRAILAKQLTEPLPRLSTLRQVPAPVEAAVGRALARSPADRFESVAAFSRSLAAPAPVPSPRRRNSLVILAAAALLVVSALLARSWLSRKSDPEGLSSAAVLPFTDLSPGNDQTWFSDGLTEELTSALSRIPGFKVAARSSAFQFRGPTVDVKDVGRKLGVATVLEGSVRRIGTQLHVSAQLVNARDGFELWSDSYNRSAADLFAVQEEIARAIATSLKLLKGARADSALVARPTTDLGAYDLYLQGQFALSQRTGQSLAQAVDLYGQALARDSGLAKAWAGLADAYVLLPAYGGTRPEIAWPRGKAAALRAIALQPGLAQAHTSLAYGTMLYDWDWKAAEAEFKKAIAADPDYPTAHHWYADFLTGRNRIDEALIQMQQAHDLDPLSRIIFGELAWIQVCLHRPAVADSLVTALLHLDPDFAQSRFIQGYVRLEQKRPAEAAAILKDLRARGEVAPNVSAALVYAYAVSGDRPAAVALLDSVKAQSKREYVPPFSIGVSYIGLGDLDQAFSWLNKAVAEKDVLMPENFFMPLLDPLKADARYAAIAARMQ